MTAIRLLSHRIRQAAAARVFHHDRGGWGSGRSSGFIEKTILGVCGLIKETISSEESAGRKGFLQQRDPRLKTAAVLLLLLAVLFSHTTLLLASIYLVVLALAALSSINLVRFLGRTLLFIPLFSLCIVVPALFSAVTPGQSVFVMKLGPWAATITRQGIDSAIIFFMRILVSVSLSVLLMITTRHQSLLKVLRIFRVPQLFVMTMGMSYRYIFLLLETVQDTFTAIKSRVGFVTSARQGRGVVAGNMAGLWLRSYRLQAQVYQAMVSRGYTGEPKTLDDFSATFGDVVFALFAGTIFIGTLWLNHFSR